MFMIISAACVRGPMGETKLHQSLCREAILKLAALSKIVRLAESGPL